MNDLFEKKPEASKEAISVGDFMAHAKTQIESHLRPCWISGEVADFVRAKSGHWYFVLRDQNGQADCMMPRSSNAHARLTIKDGDAIEVMAQPSLYPPRGRFQLSVRLLRLTGAGKLHQEYMQRKMEWAKRGWFDSDNKKSPPFFPTTIGVVSSMQGAAVRDVLRTLKSRMPTIDIVIYPSPAQGADAATKIAEAIKTANKRCECDVLIVCRGGGGMEDLWSYNEEPVVRAIVESQLPIITGIGHEIDETLADFAADVRAPTPTAAATAAAPDRIALRAQCQTLGKRLKHATHRFFDEREQRLDYAIAAVRRPAHFIRDKQQTLTTTCRRLQTAWREDFQRRQWQLQHTTTRMRLPDFSAQQALIKQLTRRLTTTAIRAEQHATSHLQHLQSVMHAYHPAHIVARGYGIIRNAQGQLITNANKLAKGNPLHITLAQGTATAAVQQTTATNDLPKPTQFNKLNKESKSKS